MELQNLLVGSYWTGSAFELTGRANEVDFAYGSSTVLGINSVEIVPLEDGLFISHLRNPS